MPQIEDLPLPVQHQIRAQRAEPAAEHPAGSDTKRRTLLERLASFGMSRQDEVAAAPPQRHPPMPQAAPRLPQAPMPYAPPQGHAPRAPQPAPPPSEYGKRPAAQPAPRHAGGPTDQHGRALPPARSFDDDQLEIPAFLRRQSN